MRSLIKNPLPNVRKWSIWLWLLKCWKNKNSYHMKMYFHLIKITLYSIKFIFIISTFFSWYQNKCLFNQNKFVFNKIYFHYINFFMISKYIFFSVKINLYLVRKIFLIYIFFHSNKFIFLIWIFHWILEYIWSSILFTKVRVLLSVCKLNNNTRMWKSC